MRSLPVFVFLSLVTMASAALVAQQPAAPGKGYPGEGRPAAVDVPPVYARPAVDTLATIRRRGRLRVGVATAMPWVMHDKDGAFIGYSVDLARQLADDIGVTLELVPSAWPNVIDDLLDNQFDVIASGLWLTPARAMLVNYSQPTSTGAVSLVGARSVAATLAVVADFDAAGVTIAVNAGTEMEEVAARRFPRATLVRLDINADPLEAVLSGKAQAAVIMSPLAAVTVATNGERLFLPKDGELVAASTAMAVRKGDPDVLNFLNAWLTYHRESGWLRERYDYWFKSTDWLKRL